MTNQKRGHRVPKEVRAEIIRRAKDEGIPVAQAVKDAGIHETTIYGWLGCGAQGSSSWSEYLRL